MGIPDDSVSRIWCGDELAAIRREINTVDLIGLGESLLETPTVSPQEK